MLQMWRCLHKRTFVLVAMCQFSQGCNLALAESWLTGLQGSRQEPKRMRSTMLKCKSLWSRVASASGDSEANIQSQNLALLMG